MPRRQRPLQVVYYLIGRELGHREGLSGWERDAKRASTDASLKSLLSFQPLQRYAEEKASLPNKNQACEASEQTRSTLLVTISPDGKRIASAHGDHSIRVTDVCTGKCLHVLNGHPRTPWCLVFHPSSSDILGSGCLAGEVRIWDLKGGGSEVFRCDEAETLSIASLTFHPLDNVIVFATGNRLNFWNWKQATPFVVCQTAHNFEKIRWVKFDHLGQFLYTGIANSSVIVANDEPHSAIGLNATSYSSLSRARQDLDDVDPFQRSTSQWSGSSPSGGPRSGARPWLRGSERLNNLSYYDYDPTTRLGRLTAGTASRVTNWSSTFSSRERSIADRYSTRSRNPIDLSDSLAGLTSRIDGHVLSYHPSASSREQTTGLNVSVGQRGLHDAWSLMRARRYAAEVTRDSSTTSSSSGSTTSATESVIIPPSISFTNNENRTITRLGNASITAASIEEAVESDAAVSTSDASLRVSQPVVECDRNSVDNRDLTGGVDAGIIPRSYWSLRNPQYGNSLHPPSRDLDAAFFLSPPPSLPRNSIAEDDSRAAATSFGVNSLTNDDLEAGHTLLRLGATRDEWWMRRDTVALAERVADSNSHDAEPESQQSENATLSEQTEIDSLSLETNHTLTDNTGVAVDGSVSTVTTLQDLEADIESNNEILRRLINVCQRDIADSEHLILETNFSSGTLPSSSVLNHPGPAAAAVSSGSAAESPFIPQPPHDYLLTAIVEQDHHRTYPSDAQDGSAPGSNIGPTEAKRMRFGLSPVNSDTHSCNVASEQRSHDVLEEKKVGQTGESQIKQDSVREWRDGIENAENQDSTNYAIMSSLVEVHNDAGRTDTVDPAAVAYDIDERSMFLIEASDIDDTTRSSSSSGATITLPPLYPDLITFESVSNDGPLSVGLLSPSGERYSASLTESGTNLLSEEFQRNDDHTITLSSSIAGQILSDVSRTFDSMPSSSSSLELNVSTVATSYSNCADTSSEPKIIDQHGTKMLSTGSILRQSSENGAQAKNDALPVASTSRCIVVAARNDDHLRITDGTTNNSMILKNTDDPDSNLWRLVYTAGQGQNPPADEVSNVPSSGANQPAPTHAAASRSSGLVLSKNCTADPSVDSSSSGRDSGRPIDISRTASLATCLQTVDETASLAARSGTGRSARWSAALMNDARQHRLHQEILRMRDERRTIRVPPISCPHRFSAVSPDPPPVSPPNINQLSTSNASATRWSSSLNSDNRWTDSITERRWNDSLWSGTGTAESNAVRLAVSAERRRRQRELQSSLRDSLRQDTVMSNRFGNGLPRPVARPHLPSTCTPFCDICSGYTLQAPRLRPEIRDRQPFSHIVREPGSGRPSGELLNQRHEDRVATVLSDYIGSARQELRQEELRRSRQDTDYDSRGEASAGSHLDVLSNRELVFRDVVSGNSASAAAASASSYQTIREHSYTAHHLGDVEGSGDIAGAVGPTWNDPNHWLYRDAWNAEEVEDRTQPNRSQYSFDTPSRFGIHSAGSTSSAAASAAGSAATATGTQPTVERENSRSAGVSMVMNFMRSIPVSSSVESDSSQEATSIQAQGAPSLVISPPSYESSTDRLATRAQMLSDELARIGSEMNDGRPRRFAAEEVDVPREPIRRTDSEMTLAERMRERQDRIRFHLEELRTRFGSSGVDAEEAADDVMSSADDLSGTAASAVPRTGADGEFLAYNDRERIVSRLRDFREDIRQMRLEMQRRRNHDYAVSNRLHFEHRDNASEDNPINSTSSVPRWRANQPGRDSWHTRDVRGESYAARLRRLRSRFQDLWSSDDDDDDDELHDARRHRYRRGEPPRYSAAMDAPTSSGIGSSQRNLSSFHVSDDPETWFDRRSSRAGASYDVYDAADIANGSRRQWGEALPRREATEELPSPPWRSSAQHLWYNRRENSLRANNVRHSRVLEDSDDDENDDQFRAHHRRAFFRSHYREDAGVRPTRRNAPHPWSNAMDDEMRSWRSAAHRRRTADAAAAANRLSLESDRQNERLQAAINRAISSAFIANGELSVGSNIADRTHRIQAWDFTSYQTPNLTESESNIVVRRAKLHNDSSCDISQDGRLLCVFLQHTREFSGDVRLGVFSLVVSSRGQCLFTKTFGPNAISVSISPRNHYVLVGLASKKFTWIFSPKQMIAQVFQLKTVQPDDDSMEHVCDIMHPCDVDIRAPISLNCARWLSRPGEGLVYGTNRGDLNIYRPGFDQLIKPDASADDGSADSNPVRNNLMQILGLAAPRTISTSTQTGGLNVRRTASTQTDRNVLATRAGSENTEQE